MVLDTVGPYRIRRKLRTTSLGVQYEATHGEDQRPVVVLVISPEYAREPGLTKRLFTEARAADSVEHPCFIPVYDRGEHTDGTAYLVYEIPAGETLRERLRRERGPLPIEQALSLGQQLASGLLAAHARGHVHRDLQPQHILLTPELTAWGGELAKLLEFGITSFAERWHATQAAQCELIAIVGNPVYMSPEQCSGIGIVDDKTDVYSLGAILYHVLAGRPPFAGEGHGVLIGQHLFQEVPPLLDAVPGIPHELAALIERMLIKPREQRPSMAQVLESLSRMRRPGAGSPARAPLLRATRWPQPEPFGVPGRISASLQELRSFVGSPAWGARRSVSLGVLGALAALSLGNLLVWQLGERHVAPAAHPPAELATTSVAAGLGPQLARAPAPRIAPAVSAPSPAMPTVAAPPLPPADEPPGPPGPLAAPVRAAVAPAPKIRWLLASEPPGALVISADDGRVLGQTPWQVSRVAVPGLQIVRLHKLGFQDTRIVLERDQSSAREVALEPLLDTAPKVSQLQRRPVPVAPAGRPLGPVQPVRRVAPSHR
jgi:serine/threonine-protein kinase